MLAHFGRCTHCKGVLSETDTDPKFHGATTKDGIMVAQILCSGCGRSEVMRLYLSTFDMSTDIEELVDALLKAEECLPKEPLTERISRIRRR